MKALSLWEPWATLMAIGAKTIETRGWPTDYRGPLAIHATQRVEEEICYAEPFFGVLRQALPPDTISRPAFAWFPRGCIVAVVNLRDVKSTRWQDSLPVGTFPPFEWQFGDYADGRYMWLTDRVQRLATPLPVRGAQKLWDLPPDIEAAVMRQIGALAA